MSLAGFLKELTRDDGNPKLETLLTGVEKLLGDMEVPGRSCIVGTLVSA